MTLKAVGAVLRCRIWNEHVSAARPTALPLADSMIRSPLGAQQRLCRPAFVNRCIILLRSASDRNCCQADGGSWAEYDCLSPADLRNLGGTH